MSEESTRTKVQVKRVYDPVEDSDGYRVLVDRLWPRGIRKADFKSDEWNKQIAPSTEIRKAFGHRPENFQVFAADYRQELESNPAVTQLVKRIQECQPGTLTLLIAAKNPVCNHGLVLKKYLEDQGI